MVVTRVIADPKPPVLYDILLKTMLDTYVLSETLLVVKFVYIDRIFIL